MADVLSGASGGPVESATRAALAAVELSPADVGVRAVLLKLARAVDDIGEDGTRDGKLDNVTIPTYLRYAEALGMTPAARRAAVKGAERVSKPAVSGLEAARGMVPAGLRVVS